MINPTCGLNEWTREAQIMLGKIIQCNMIQERIDRQFFLMGIFLTQF